MEFGLPRSRSTSTSSKALTSGVAAAGKAAAAAQTVIDLTLDDDDNSGGLAPVEENLEDGDEDSSSSSSSSEEEGDQPRRKPIPNPSAPILNVPPLTLAPPQAPAPAPTPYVRLRSASELVRGNVMGMDYLFHGGKTTSAGEEEQFRHRMWPPRALISFCRIITRCRPPAVTPGKPLSGHAGNTVSLVPHWMNDDLSAIPTAFDNTLMHASVFFPLVVEESREASLHSLGYGGWAGASSRQNAYARPHPPAWDTNGWLDAEVVSVIQESDTVGAVAGSHGASDISRGTVWTLRVVLTPLGTKNRAHAPHGDTSSKAKGCSEGTDTNNPSNVPFVSPAEIFTGGDLLVMCAEKQLRPVLGVVQGWDPEYESRYSESLQREWMASDGRDPVSASKDADGREIMNILVTVDTAPLASTTSTSNGNDRAQKEKKGSSGQGGAAVPLDLGSPSAVALRNAGHAKQRHAGGWASPGAIRAGTVFSVCAVGSMVTSIRECQALLSFRDIHPSFQSAILTSQYSFSSSTASASHTCSSTAGGGRQGTQAADREEQEPSRPVTMPPQLWTKLMAAHNPSQLRAIRSICHRENQTTSMFSSSGTATSVGTHGSFSLLQGPPGTGKTRTILALVATILAGATDPPVKKVTRILPGQALRRSSQNTGSSDFLDSLSKQMTKVDAETSRRDRASGRVRVLICAPSNTAVDEIAYRLKTQGVLGADGRRKHSLNVVRIGRAGGRAGVGTGADVYSRGSHQGDTRTHSTDMLRVVDRCALDSLVEDLRRRHHNQGSALHASGRTGGAKTGVEIEMGAHWSMAEARKVIIREADVVCATLSGAGSQPLVEAVMKQPGFKFDAVIVDEAAQATEPSSIIPLKYNPRNVILVGDPAQLPATVFSKVAKQAGLGRSLFERLQEGGYPVLMLETQYRMHPHIAEYPSREFYQGKLLTDQHLLAGGGATRDRAYHHDSSGRFRPFVLHDVSHGREEQEGVSILNRAEAAYVCDLYGDLVRLYPGADAVSNVGIIAPYRAQRTLLKQMFKTRFGADADVEISTVDGFQGREKDVVIFSAVRAPAINSSSSSSSTGSGSAGGGHGGEESIGFLKEWQRLNVAMTRARHALWIVGHRDVLRKDEHCWGRLVRFVVERGWLHEASGADSSQAKGAPSRLLHNHRANHGYKGDARRRRGGGGQRQDRDRDRDRDGRPSKARKTL